MHETLTTESTALSSRERSAAVPALRPLKTIARWFVAWRTARARRRALVTLLEMDEARLVDLGIERQDIHLAMENERFWRAFSHRPMSRRSPAQKVSVEATDIFGQHLRDF